MSNTTPSFTFVHSNRRVIAAWGALKRLPDLMLEHGAQRAAVVMDGYFRGSEVARRIEAMLPVAGAKPVFHFVPPEEPDTASIEACAAALAAVAPDCIIAVGGGSAMDTAKVARLMLANPGDAESVSGFGKRFLPHGSLLIAVPTTAGTGSEVSESAVAGRSGSDIKLIFRSPEMTPQIALLDASLSVSAPAKVTAASGYDAITHAVEAYVSNAASAMSDPFAESALRLLATWLPVAYGDPGHALARHHCLVASCQAAIAFNSANLGLAHAFAAPLGALFHVPHGLANALALPVVAAYNEPAMGAKAQVIAEAFGSAGASEGLARVRRALGLDLSLDEFVPDDTAREQLAQAAMRSGQVKMNPRLATLDHVRAMIQAMRTPTGDAAPVLSI
ncbi:MAG: iron-containing alcohol dehydrogenase [Variovorax sp.]